MKYQTYQIEMLFVLSTLLSCKRKNEIQDKLSNYEIIDILNNYLEYLDWGNVYSESNRPSFENDDINYSDDTAYHGKGCKCDSDTALKIQFLRFIYTYCCRDNVNTHNKLNLISFDDIKNILCPNYLILFYHFFFKNYEKYKDDSNVKFNNMFKKYMQLTQGVGINKFNTQFTNKSEQDIIIQNIILNDACLENINKFALYFNSNNDAKIGLIKKIIIKYIQECPHSSSKFWLASCIEVMIRGNNTFFQYFIGSSTGLISCLLYDIIYSKNDQIQILQLSFDILGELIKFNKANFLLMNYFFVDNNEFKSFTKKIIDKNTMVDSNVFLRAIILTIDYFDNEDEKLKLEKQNYFTYNCKFCLFLNENIQNIFNFLIQVVKPSEINQTNISCINTALLILILMYKKRKLDCFLNEIRRKYDDSFNNLNNFKKLLLIWKEFYNYRPKDSASLQHSTMIKFNVWQIVTTILLVTDESKEDSLYYKF